MAWQALDGSYYDGNFEFLHNTTTVTSVVCAAQRGERDCGVQPSEWGHGQFASEVQRWRCFHFAAAED